MVVKTFIILLIKVSVNIFNVLKSGSTWKACKCAEMFVLLVKSVNHWASLISGVGSS